VKASGVDFDNCDIACWHPVKQSRSRFQQPVLDWLKAAGRIKDGAEQKYAKGRCPGLKSMSPAQTGRQIVPPGRD
jgi:hypothetical protein